MKRERLLRYLRDGVALVAAIHRQILAHKRWLLLLIPVGILGSPFLLMAMLIGSRLLSALIGPVNVWNITKHVPPVADLAGEYGGPDPAGRGKLHDGLSDHSGFRLSADRRAEVFDLPAYDVSGTPLPCVYRGMGNWMALEVGDVTISIDIKELAPAPPGAKPSCDTKNLGFQLLGRSPPYKLWYYIGDPDEDTGLTFVRRGL